MAEETKAGDTASEPEAEPLSAEASGIIRRHAFYAAAGGFVPFPVAEFFVNSAIQLRMIGQLCDHYRLPFSENAVKSAIAAMAGSAVSVHSVGYAGFSLVRFVPVIGQVVGLLTLPALAGAMTWAVGRVFAWHFARGGTLESLDGAAKKGQFKREFEEGKRRASEFVKGAKGAGKSGTAEAKA